MLLSWKKIATRVRVVKLLSTHYEKQRLESTGSYKELAKSVENDGGEGEQLMAEWDHPGIGLFLGEARRVAKACFLISGS